MSITDAAGKKIGAYSKALKIARCHSTKSRCDA